MSFSYYEVYNNTLRAFRGLEFPYGADEDAAYIITWLELNNLNGVNLLSTSLKEYEKGFNGKIEKHNFSKNSFDLMNNSTLMVAPNLIDYISTKMLHKDEQLLELKNCSYVIYFIPMLVKLLNKNIYSLIKNKNKNVCTINSKKVSLNNSLIIQNKQKKDFSIFFSKNNLLNENLDSNINLFS